MDYPQGCCRSAAVPIVPGRDLYHGDDGPSCRHPAGAGAAQHPVAVVVRLGSTAGLGALGLAVMPIVGAAVAAADVVVVMAVAGAVNAARAGDLPAGGPRAEAGAKRLARTGTSSGATVASRIDARGTGTKAAGGAGSNGGWTIAWHTGQTAQSGIF